MTRVLPTVRISSVESALCDINKESLGNKFYPTVKVPQSFSGSGMVSLIVNLERVVENKRNKNKIYLEDYELGETLAKSYGKF